VDGNTDISTVGDHTLLDSDPGYHQNAGLFETVFCIDARMQSAPRLDQSCERAAARAPDEFKHLVFQVNFCQFAIALANLVEVIPETSITRIPNVPNWLLGVSNLRGEIISIVDLRQLLKMESFHQQRSEAVIVVRSPQAELITGFVVDQLCGFRNLQSLEETGPSTLPQYAQLPFTDRVLQTESQQLAVLDIEKLLGSPEFCRFRL
jgi:purine-binding chemotaxis protein CheW